MNRRIAEALFDIAKKSTTSVIDVAEDKELIEAASKLGIVVPSPDLAIIKTIYAEIDTVNRNGVVLPRKAVEDGLPTLVGKQVNWEHMGSGQVCGYTIDAKINEDKIEIIAVVFKSLFPEEFETVTEKFQKGTLAVSFEIWNRNDKGESVVHDLEDGNVSIDPIIFHGTGLLLTSQPACPKAHVYKLLAKEEVTNIKDKVFSEDLVYAKLAIDEPKCGNCGTCKCGEKEEIVEELMIENDYDLGEIEEAKKLTTEQRNALPDSDFALIQEKDGKKIRRFPINDEAHVRNALARLPQAKDLTDAERAECLKKILKKAKELNMDELLKKYEKAEEVVEEAKKKLCKECNQPLSEDMQNEEICADCKKKKVEKSSEIPVEETKVEAEAKPEEVMKTTPEEAKVETEVKPEENKTDANVTTEKTESVRTVDTNQPGKDVVTTEVKSEVTTVNNEGQEIMKREEKVETVVTYTFEQVEEKVASAKAELQKVVEEKDKEIAKLKQELELSKPQEIVKAKEEETAQPDLTVGSVETTGNDKYREIQAKINMKAYGHR